MKKLLILFLHCFVFISLNARDGGYTIRNYSAKEYGGFNQVWCSVQDSNGIVYFGTSTNIFSFDGKSWTAIFVKTGTPIRSLYLGEDGIIYVGSYGTFGFLEKQNSGKMVYRELSNQLPANEQKFTDLWRVFSLKGEIVFQSSQGVFFFKSHKYVTSILPTKTFALSFLCKGHLYIRQREIGIQEIINHKLSAVKGGERFADQRCLDIIPWKNGEFMVLTGDSGFFSFSPTIASGFHALVFSSNKYLHDCFVLGAKYIDDSTIAIFNRIGIGFLDQNGNLKESLNTEDGLIDNSVSGILVDREGQLWLTTGNGISHVFYHSNIKYFHSRKSGFEGDINSIIDYKEQIYLASTGGLFRSINKSSDKNNSFELIGFDKTELWAFLQIDEDLFVASSQGLFLYKEGKPAEYLSTAVTRDLVFNFDSSRIYAAELGGISCFIKQNNKWELSAFAETPGEQQSILISQYKFVGGERVWSIGQSGVLYRIDFGEKENKIRTFSTESGIHEAVAMFCIIGDSICAKTARDIYVYHTELDKGEGSFCFLPSPAMNKVVADKETGINFTCTEKGKLIRTTELYQGYSIRNYGFFKKNKQTGLFDNKFITLPECPAEDFIYSYVDLSGNFWMSFIGELVKCDLQLPEPKVIPFNTMITQVRIGKDSILFTGASVTNSELIQLEYKSNHITFRFSAPIFNHEEFTTYGFMLEGFDKEWSPYLPVTEKEYTNLPEGDYVFKVRSYDAVGNPGKIGNFRFTILPPWYRTIWAYSIYVFLFLFIIFISIRLGARRLRIQKEKLEAIVTERTFEVVEQKKQIETQNHELESAYKGIQDSIHYAERIQHAILPLTSEINTIFPDSFVLFRPRDIVSGDFYWMVTRGSLTWIACVDCTGHGVPGAFMSMIGNTLLNEIVLEKNIESPDKILDLLHIRIRQALRQDAGGETRDGMDISLCMFNHEKQKLSYAGANRAIWIIRNNELNAIPADKFSIGGDQENEVRHFKLTELNIINGDCIYLSSDGYADQFGGPKGKKFMVKKFQEVLLEIHTLPMIEQGIKLEKTFLEWKGLLEQVDDVLVIGIKIN